jgi:hypothetical protein
LAATEAPFVREGEGIHLNMSDRKLATDTVMQWLAALRFLYIQVPKRGWSVAETPCPKKVLRLPQVP